MFYILRKLLALLAAPLLLACQPPGFSTTTPNIGWEQARNGNAQPVRVADIPYIANDFDITAPWDWTAGKQLFETNSPNPQITFQEMSPIDPPGDHPPVAAWVERHVAPSGYLYHVTIHFDPWYWAWWQLTDPMTWRHELGHALGLGGDTLCSHPYRGVLSYCGPYGDAWGADDVEMLRNTGYRTS